MYELIIIFFIIYPLYIIVILMLIYVYADVAPIRYCKRNKEPISDIALRGKKWKEEKTSGGFRSIIAHIKKERKRISGVGNQHKQEWTMLTIREKKRTLFWKFNENKRNKNGARSYRRIYRKQDSFGKLRKFIYKGKVFFKKFPKYL